MLALLLASLVSQVPSVDGPILASSPVILSAPLTTSGHLPPCLASDSCVLDCGVGIATGADAWECVDGSGAQVAVTQAVNTFSDTPFIPSPGGSARRAVTPTSDTNAPKLTTPGFLHSVWRSPHTFVAFARGPNNSFPFSHGVFGQAGVYMNLTATQFSCRWMVDAGGSVATVGANVTAGSSDKWVVGACRKTATDAVARVNGTNSSPFTDTRPVVDPTTQEARFGTYSGGSGSVFATPARVRVYSRALSDAELTRIEAQWFGSIAGERNLTVSRASPAWVEDGQTARVNMVPKSEAIDTWGNNAFGPGCSMVPNAAADPDGKMTAALLTDSDPATVCSKLEPVSIAAGKTYTYSGWIRLGTAPSARIRWGATNMSSSCGAVAEASGTSWKFVQCVGTATATGLGYPVIEGPFVTSQTGTAYFAKLFVVEGSTASPSDYCRTTTTPGQCGGQWHAVGDGAIRIKPGGGALGEEGTTNYWTNSLDQSAAAKNGTPIVTTNTAAGPFSAYNSGPECDDLEDDDAAASEGTLSPSAGTAAGPYTTSAFVQHLSGDTNFRLQVLGSGGTAENHACVFLGIDKPATATCTGGPGFSCNIDRSTTPARYSCTSTQSAGHTGITGLITLGGTAANLQKIRVCHAQFEPKPYATSPAVCGPSACQRTNEGNPQVSTAGWPVQAGQVELEYTPFAASTLNRVLLDTRTAGGLAGITVYVGSNQGLGFIMRDGTGSGTSQLTSPLTWAPTTPYRIRVQWSNGRAYLYRDGVLVGSAAGPMPAAHSPVAIVGANLSGGENANGHIRLLKVSR